MMSSLGSGPYGAAPQVRCVRRSWPTGRVHAPTSQRAQGAEGETTAPSRCPCFGVISEFRLCVSIEGLYRLERPPLSWYGSGQPRFPFFGRHAAPNAVRLAHGKRMCPALGQDRARETNLLRCRLSSPAGRATLAFRAKKQVWISRTAQASKLPFPELGTWPR
jgi:hypothetical protein